MTQIIFLINGILFMKLTMLKNEVSWNDNKTIFELKLIYTTNYHKTETLFLEHKTEL